MRAYLKRSNDIPSSSLNSMSPLDKRKSLTRIKHNQKSLVKEINIHELYLNKTS